MSDLLSFFERSSDSLQKTALSIQTTSQDLREFCSSSDSFSDEVAVFECANLEASSNELCIA